MFGGMFEDQTLVHATRERARAEAAELATMLDYAQRGRAQAEAEREPMRRMLLQGAVAGQIAELAGLSEGQVFGRLAVADRVSRRTPRVWKAFQTGAIDFARVREISSVIEKLHETESVDLLDDKVVEYAAEHTTGELKTWLRRFVIRVEAEHALARAEAERNARDVAVLHGDEGMSTVMITCTSLAAAAIESRLRREAGRLKDERTKAQKRSDLAVSWLTSAENSTHTDVKVDIAVVVDADVLAGVNPGFAESPDGAWVAPATWVAEIATPKNSFWWRMLREPATQDILSIEYQGRFAPEKLKRALTLLYGTCQGAGCLRPAAECDIDHRIPWPRGKTIGHNLGPYCDREHGRKGHGITIRGRPRLPADHTESRLLEALVEHHYVGR